MNDSLIVSNKTIIYNRTSTKDQHPENQLNDCLSINTYGNYEILEEQDSAWKDSDRIEFDKIISLIKKKKINHLIIWDLDRLYRNRKKIIEFFQLCKIYDVKIHSFRQGWLEKLNTLPEPFNEIMFDLMLQIMGWLAEEESNKKSERVRNARRFKEDGVYSYKGNKWGRNQISTFKKNKIKELKEKNKSIRFIANELKISIGVVHKYIEQTKQENNKEK